MRHLKCYRKARRMSAEVLVASPEKAPRDEVGRMSWYFTKRHEREPETDEQRLFVKTLRRRM